MRMLVSEVACLRALLSSSPSAEASEGEAIIANVKDGALFRLAKVEDLHPPRTYIPEGSYELHSVRASSRAPGGPHECKTTETSAVPGESQNQTASPETLSTRRSDTALARAIRRAFDYPSIANIEAVAVEAKCEAPGAQGGS